MSRRRAIGLFAAVVALLVVVAVVALGRPLGKSAGRGAGLSPTFWDVVFTTALLVVGLAAVVAIGAFFFLRRPALEPRPLDRSRTVRALVILIAGAALIYFVGRHIDLNRLLHRNGTRTTSVQIRTSVNLPLPGGKPGYRHAHFEWPEAVVVLGALLALAAVYATRSRKRLNPRPRGVPPEELMLALDESVDDLRSDPDVRRAIVAAYARMEKALALAGLPRDPAEAPLEYVERVLLGLDTSEAAVRKLTDLFEWARFSQHEPEPSMRDEAIDALVAVRDELRATEPVETW